MATGQLGGLIQNLRRTAFSRDSDALMDAELLDAFLAHADEGAFETLVRRHSGMVWGVCLRALGHTQDAEDAFQATFLVLLRKASSIWPREMVGNWLYGVAHRTALKAKALAFKRNAREKQVDDMPAVEAHPEKTWSDLQPVLDGELHRLADKYRIPIVLCDLEGKSQRDAARQLGWPEGTLTTRLTRGRKLLAKRLTRRGLALSAGGFALLLAQQAGHAAPAHLLAPTLNAAALMAAGQAASVVTSASVAALAEGVMHTMFLAKIKSALIGIVALICLATGGGIVTHRVFADRSAAPNQVPIVLPEMVDDFTLFQDREVADLRRPATPASVTGKIVAVAEDGKGFTLETPPINRGDAPLRKQISFTDLTKLTFSSVGPDGAKLREGLTAQVWLDDGAKQFATVVALIGAERLQRDPDASGKVVRVSNDGSTLTIETAPRGRTEAAKATNITINARTSVTYSGIGKGGAKPADGYLAQVWFAKASKDVAATIHFHGAAATERSRAAAVRPNAGGKVIAVSKNAKVITLEVPPEDRRGEPGRADYKLDDKTQVLFFNVAAGSDQIAEGQLARISLVDGSKDTVGVLLLSGMPQDRSSVLRGKITSVARDGKSFTMELPPTERGAEPKNQMVKLSATAHALYMGVGPGGAQPTVGYDVDVWFEEGSTTNAAQVIFGVNNAANRR